MNPKRVALVTGGNRGIGKAIVEKFAGEGINVVFNNSQYNDEARILSQDLMNKYKVEVLYLPANLKNQEEAEKLADQALEKFGRVDILVNNAAIMYHSPFLDIPLEEFKNTLSVNLISPFLLCQKLIPNMKANKFGRIINISTIATERISPNMAAYISPKSGLQSLTKCLALEFADKRITVNNILPSGTETDMLYQFAEQSTELPRVEALELVKSYIPTKTLIKPSEVANLVLFLASEEAKNITGSNFKIDSGWSI
jgi:NAD(P)-dependent dehydrogenase (short-subunit alcohol dehydrogenase family)